MPIATRAKLGKGAASLGGSAAKDDATRATFRSVWQKKREYAEHIVNLADGDYELAAGLLDIHPSGFHAYLRRLELDHLLP